jgi:hypothetical protein
MGNRDEQLPSLSLKNSTMAIALSHNRERHITIKIKHFDPCMAPVTKDVERSASGILPKTAAHQTPKTVEAFAHIAAVDHQEYLQAPAEADHRFEPSRPSTSAASAASAALLT